MATDSVLAPQGALFLLYEEIVEFQKLERLMKYRVIEDEW